MVSVYEGDKMKIIDISKHPIIAGLLGKVAIIAIIFICVFIFVFIKELI